MEIFEDESWNIKTEFLRIKIMIADMWKGIERIFKDQQQKGTDLDIRIKQLEDKLQF